MMGDTGSVAAVQAECDRRLDVLNHDDSSPTTSFEYLQWALSLLRHFHHQEDRLGGDEAANGEPAVSQLGKRKAESEPSIAEDEDGTEMDSSGVASSPSHANDVSTSADGMKNADAEAGNVESLEEAVRRADSGKAGIRMAQIVGIWIGRRQCHALVHLIRQCLCESLNQVSPFATKSDEEEGGVPESSLWLHNWLVREVMQNNISSTHHRSPLDWLIAHLTAASPSLFLGPVIYDLWENVITSRANAMVSLSFYVRRIGILEYAALRGSEQVAVELERIFSNMGFIVGSVEGERRTDKKRLMEMWSMWLVIATLCPKFLAACCRHWIPNLTVRLLESYGSLFVDVIDMGSPLTPLWFILEGVNHEKPTRLSVWLSAILSRRISELAAVGTSLVVLLNRLVGKKGKLDKGVLEIASSLLRRLHMDLSVRILPCVLGTEQTVGAEPLSFTTEIEYTGYSLFIDNLKTNLKKLWLELLSGCSESSFSAAQSVPPNKDLKQRASEPIAGVRGWWNGDPFVGVCRITILSSGHNAVAQLLAEETVAGRSDNGGLDAKSVTKLFFVMEVMKMVAGQGRGVQVFELWSQLCVAAFNKSDDEEALQRAIAVKQLLDPAFWQSHQSEQPSDLGNASEGVSWKVVWMLLRKVMDSQWLHLVPLLHRKNAWEFHLVMLQILQSLAPGSDTHSQAVVVRLKALLGIFFQLVDESHERNVEPEDSRKWHVLEHLKRVTVQQASSSFASFTVLVSSLLDYPFDRSDRLLDKKFQRRGGGANNARGTTSTLVPGRLDQNGSFTLVSLPALKESTNSSLASPKFSLTEENRWIKSAGLPSLGGKDTRFGSIRRREDGVVRPAFHVSKDDAVNQELVDTVVMELGDVLRRAAGSAVLRAAEDSDAWSSHPAFIMASQMIDRLGTPHELAMTMEQYEEVLPKQVSTPRHILLTECFGRNPLLLEMLELVVKYKTNGSDEVLRCVEFIRVLLVDSISRWHSAYRTRRAPGLPPPRVLREDNKLDRMHVIWLINLVADAGWLPQPLASTIEIIEVIDGADVADLLLLVWRCMHHAMSFGTKSWGGNSPPVLPQTEKAQNQVTEGGSGRDGTYTEWEGHLFAILRQNIAHIGAHFAQVYPKHDTL